MLTLPLCAAVNRNPPFALMAYDPKFRGESRVDASLKQIGETMSKLLNTLLAAGIAALTFNVAAQTAPAPAAPAAAPAPAPAKSDPVKAAPATPAAPSAEAKADKPKKAKADKPKKAKSDKSKKSKKSKTEAAPAQ